MTTYRLLIDSPKYDKYLGKIKKVAKRYKKRMEITGKEISFTGRIWPKYGRPESIEVSGSGVEIQLL